MSDEEKEGLIRYLKLELLRDNNVISEVEEKEINELTKFETVARLEEAHRLLNNNEISKEEFNKIHDTYRLEMVNEKLEEQEDLDLLEKEILEFE